MTKKPSMHEVQKNFTYSRLERAVMDQMKTAGIDYDDAPPVTRDVILSTAGELINGDRAKDYGDASENFQRIANLWKPILGTEVTATDVALCLTQLKVARLITSPHHKDSWIDACGYLALGGEIANKEQNK